MAAKKEETALAVPEVRVLSAKEKTDGEKRYTEKVSYFDTQEVSAFRHVLVTTWEKGQFVDELLNDGKKYGNATVERFATDLRRRELLAQGKTEKEVKELKVSGDSLHACHRYFLRNTPEEVEKQVKLRLPWRAAHILLSVDDKRKRDEFLKTYLDNRDHPDAAKKMTSDDLAEVVKKYNAGERASAARTGKQIDKRGGPSWQRSVRSTAAMSEDFLQKLEEFRLVIQEYSKVDDSDTDPSLEDKIQEACKTLKGVQEKLAAAIKLAEK
jgi:hypothetical protein